MIKKIAAILALNFVNILGFSILIPILPTIVESYNGSEFMYGLLISVYSMFQFFAAPIMGNLSDIYGRRPVLIISQGGTLISWIIFGSAFFIPDFDLKIMSLPVLVLLIARIFDGITGGNTTVANAYITDVVKPEEKIKAFGLVGAVFGIGFLIGPVIGALSFATDYGYAGTSLLAAFISFVTLLLMIFKLPESLIKSKRKEKLKFNLFKELNLMSRIKGLKLNKKMHKLFVLRFFFSMAFTGYIGIIILFIQQRYGLSEQEISYLLLVLGGYAIFNQLVLVPFMVKKIGELKVYYIGYLSLIMSMFILIFKIPLWAFILLEYFISISIDSCNPTFKTIISNYISDDKQGAAQGVDEAFLSIGRATAPLIVAVIYSYLNSYTFGVMSLFLILPLLISGFVYLPKVLRKAEISQFDNIPFNE